MSSKTAPGTGTTVFGVIAIVAGMLCMLMPGITGLSVAVFIGVLVLIAGITRMIWAFKAGRRSFHHQGAAKTFCRKL